MSATNARATNAIVENYGEPFRVLLHPITGAVTNAEQRSLQA